nr:MAG TPA: hypothetical protein [Bacteriophage sp.]DAY35610.1 MAG TPA: hypothetical protein [Caudoviricetes sp.]
MVFHKGDFIRHKSTLINGEKEVTVYSCDHLSTCTKCQYGA